MIYVVGRDKKTSQIRNVKRANQNTLFKKHNSEIILVCKALCISTCNQLSDVKLYPPKLYNKYRSSLFFISPPQMPNRSNIIFW